MVHRPRKLVHKPKNWFTWGVFGSRGCASGSHLPFWFTRPGFWFTRPRVLVHTGRDLVHTGRDLVHATVFLVHTCWFWFTPVVYFSATWFGALKKIKIHFDTLLDRYLASWNYLPPPWAECYELTVSFRKLTDLRLVGNIKAMLCLGEVALRQPRLQEVHGCQVPELRHAKLTRPALGAFIVRRIVARNAHTVIV